MTVAAPAVGQLVVTWSADLAAVKYYVYQSVSGGDFGYVASVVDSSGGPPPTTWTALGVISGIGYCYAIQSAYADGTMSDIGAPGCSPGSAPSCHVAVSRVAGLAVRLDITANCSGAGWSLDYRMISSAGGLAVATTRDHPCGFPTHVEMLVTGQLPLADFVASGWIYNGPTRVDCTVSTQ